LIVKKTKFVSICSKMDTRKEKEKGLPELWKELRELSISKKLKSLSLQNSIKFFDSTSCIPLDDEGGLLDFRELARSIIDDIFNNLQIWTYHQALVAAEIESTIQTDVAAILEAAVQSVVAASSKTEQTDVVAELNTAAQAVVAAEMNTTNEADAKAKILAWVPVKHNCPIPHPIPHPIPCELEIVDITNEYDEVTSSSSILEILDIISKNLSRTSGFFARMFHSFIKSGCFNYEIVLSFLQEIAIFAELMITHEGLSLFPVFILQTLQDLAIQQVTTFELLMSERDNAHAEELLWLLVKVTEYQKDFLNKFMEETIEFKHLMGSCAESWNIMLNLEEDFFLKLIARLHESKNEQTPTVPNSIEV